MFVFVTISKFGALNCALIGLARKMLSLLLSFVLYGHTLNAAQTVGLALSLAAMIANFYEKVCSIFFSSFFALLYFNFWFRCYIRVVTKNMEKRIKIKKKLYRRKKRACYPMNIRAMKTLSFQLV